MTPTVRPGQVVPYNDFEPYQFPDWRDFLTLEPGMVKRLQLVGGYGHLSYRPLQRQPVQVDRGVRVEVEKAP